MDELRQAVARIEENIKYLRRDVAPLVETVQEHSDQLLLIKNDKKWAHFIVTSLFGLMGVIIGALAEFLRK